MPQSKGKLYASTFRKFLQATLDLDYSIDDIEQGLVPNEVKLLINPKLIVDYFRMASCGNLNPQANDCNGIQGVSESTYHSNKKG